jgi:hypothetical protein
MFVMISEGFSTPLHTVAEAPAKNDQCQQRIEQRTEQRIEGPHPGCVRCHASPQPLS